MAQKIRRHTRLSTIGIAARRRTALDCIEDLRRVTYPGSIRQNVIFRGFFTNRRCRFTRAGVYGPSLRFEPPRGSSRPDGRQLGDNPRARSYTRPHLQLFLERSYNVRLVPTTSSISRLNDPSPRPS